MDVQVARRPRHRRPDVGHENGVVGGRLVDEAREELRVDRRVSVVGGQLVELRARLAVVLERRTEVIAVAADAQHRQEGARGLADIADEAEVDRGAPAQLLTAHIHLDDRGVLRVELPVGQVAAEDEQRVALLHRPVPRREAEKTGHPDVEGVVVFDVLLAAQGVHDRCLEPVRERDDLVMGTRDPGAGEDRHGVAGIQQLRSGLELALGRNDARPGGLNGGRRASLGCLLEEDVAGHDDHGDPALLHGRAHRRLQHPRELRRVGDEFAVVTALAEQLLRVGLLEVGGPDLG